MYFIQNGRYIEKPSGSSENLLSVLTKEATFIAGTVDGAFITAVTGSVIYVVMFTLTEILGAPATFRWRSNATNVGGIINLAALETKIFTQQMSPWAESVVGVSLACNVGGSSISIGSRYITATP